MNRHQFDRFQHLANRRLEIYARHGWNAITFVSVFDDERYLVLAGCPDPLLVESPYPNRSETRPRPAHN